MANNIKFRDVAHFYLGCKIKTPLNEITTFDALDSIEKNKGMHITSYESATAYYHVDSVKPILLPLKSVNDKHVSEYLKSTGNPQTREESLEQMALLILELTQKRFDLFGLIKSGQAIDATTIK